jgi:hypothetical protein
VRYAVLMMTGIKRVVFWDAALYSDDDHPDNRYSKLQ